MRDASIAVLKLEPAMLQWTDPGEWKERAEQAAAKRAAIQFDRHAILVGLAARRLPFGERPFAARSLL